MAQILKTWKRKTGPGIRDVKGINVTREGVEFWFETPDRVASRVSLHQFHNEEVKSDMVTLTHWIGEQQAPEVKQFVADLMVAHKDYVD